jgi:hypothetical protein
MGQNYGDCTAATALGATGIETLMGVITATAKAKRIVGVWASILGAATMTTGQPVSGIFRLDSPDVNLAPCKWPLAQVSILTSGAVAMQTHIIPVDIPIQGLANISCYITIDLTNTATLKGRVGIIFEA